MLELTDSFEHAFRKSQSWIFLAELQSEFRHLADTVADVELVESASVDKADSTLAAPRSN